MTQSDFSRLTQPITIGGCEIRNRIVMTGHGTGMPTDGTPNDQMVAYYEERAKGEVGLIMLGTQQVHPSSPGITGLLTCYDDRIIPGLKRVADAVHKHGGRIFGYLGHMGMASSARPVALWSASATYEQKFGEVAHEMTRAEIAELVASFAAAARRNLTAGMDGIEVHCGHGLLLMQYLSPHTNFRTDEYGGSVENRTRFPREVLAAVRAEIGPDVPLGIRVSGDELVPGGLTVEDMEEICTLLVEAGDLDYIDVSAGTDGDLVSNMLHEPPMGLPPAPYASVAGRIKAACPGVAILHATRIHTAAEAEALLARGDADMAGMVRPLIADPHLPAKARRGDADRVTPCVACEQACFGRLYRGRHISCVGNPTTGREQRWYGLPQATPKRVTIIGAGPSGMEAARIAALRGHTVTLHDEHDVLGGRMNVARLPSWRSEWGRMVAHKASEIDKLGVMLKLAARADLDTIRADAPDVVLLACGSKPNPLKMPGIETAPVVIVDDAVKAPEICGKRVLIIDNMNRTPGTACALHLAERGHEVSIATQGLHAGHQLVIQNLTLFHRRAAEMGVNCLTSVRPVRFDGGSVTLHNVFSRKDLPPIEVDTIVVADPGLPRNELFEPLETAGINVRAIGDAYAPRDIEAAFLDGYEAAIAL
ncbi:oxidoreductase [Salipiger pallidus]|uniref:Oxidoreductase n=1 Tax=Salipiger pallidus TaxID=1775170 RepID=A0A8J2ZL56_9RHOB|nr:FAD-dependent oxidoreductase [Salipiger pallidus]GGG76384.1 oxidoreductase [Salipiger pallidus]